MTWKHNGDPDGDTSLNYYVRVFSDNVEIRNSGWIEESTWTARDLSDGNYEWTVQVGDRKVGSILAARWRFTVDTVAPTGSFTLNHGWATASSVSMPLDLTATDQHSGVQDVRVGSTCASLGAWQPFQPRIWWQAVGQHGDTARVCVQFRDRAGNLSQAVEQSTRLDFYPAQPSSASYRLRSDVSAISGEPHQSGNYRLNSTAGQTLASGSYATSTGYRAALGFWPRFFFTPATFTISGRITDANGNGLGSVTISDGTRIANTTSNGDYTISGVPAGSYTLTPSRSGYTFNPSSLSVTVNGNVTGHNFT
ncbi:MAG: carboxypeptidase regulatory-like domain-containing protein, partial [Chloroflexia bacterium]|nr:carboxypeptidase regulatory-like domain-containing protein [Chloroflexia bacterium]